MSPSPTRDSAYARRMTTETSSVAPILIGKKQAAQALGICVRTLENLIAAREIPARKIGRRTLIRYADLAAFARRDHYTKPSSEAVADAQ